MVLDLVRLNKRTATRNKKRENEIQTNKSKFKIQNLESKLTHAHRFRIAEKREGIITNRRRGKGSWREELRKQRRADLGESGECIGELDSPIVRPEISTLRNLPLCISEGFLGFQFLGNLILVSSRRRRNALGAKLGRKSEVLRTFL